MGVIDEGEFEINGKNETKKGKFKLSAESKDGEKLTLHLGTREQLEKYQIGDILTVKVTAVSNQQKLT
jgi:ribosomal 50S subunit-recycling heat shock protein